ncbi:uncharacterized protein LOC114290737 [Camellia sinensis]|uniref:uncharacterized protein LOC114290737 n=1 Tax=Camellia sinensis TaxID=4442 RepID=UPI0010368C6A|nr:uncharacterized protein LOC114290737 [Camellia sinensis]
MREFSKSLTDRVFSWYANLAAGSISSWEDLVKKFYIKFFYVEERLTILHLMRETQRLGEDILVYVRHFREKAVDIQDPMEEHQLLVNHHFPDFSTLCATTRNISEIVRSGARRKAPQLHSWRAATPPPSLWRPNRCNHAVYAAGGSNRGRTSLQAKKRKFDQIPPPSPISVDEAQALLNAWVEDGKVHLSEPRRPVTKKDQARADYYIYHRFVKHPTAECWALRSLVRKMMADDALELPCCQTKDVLKDLLPRHKDNGKTVMMLSHYDETEEPMVCELSELAPPTCPDFETRCTIALKKSTKFKWFFDQFDKQVPFPYNRPLYVPVFINGMEFQRGFMDGRASLNVMPYSTFQATGISHKHLVRQPISITGFGNQKIKTIGHVQLDFTVGPIRSTTKFHVIEAETTYQALLGRTWLYRYTAIPSTYHQCVKAIYNNEVVAITGSQKPFQVDEAHMANEAFYNHVDEDEPPLPLQGTPIPNWDDLSEEDASPYRRKMFARSKPSRKLPKVTRLQTEDGRVVYHL